MKKEILLEDLDNIDENIWVYPKKITNSFDRLIVEEFEDLQFPIECKRCGKEFKRKYTEQIFCSRECSRIYKTKMRQMKEKHGDKFLN